MGFYFSRQKQVQAKRGPKGLRNAPATKQNTQTLNRLGCSGCPLDKAEVCTPKMQPTLAKNTDVYFLAEAPGKHEDETSGKPLTGPSGKLLRDCIPEGIESVCSFDNVVRDRPPKNRTPVWQEIECCRGHVIASIEKAKPKIIVGLGTVPLSWMLSSGDMAGRRGRLYAVKVGNHSCWFLPTYHPSFILRTAFNKEKPLNSKFGHCFRMDVDKAFKLLKGLKPPKVDTENEARAGVQCFNGGSLLTLLGLLNKARKAPVKAVDLETSALRPYAVDARILTVAISFSDINFSFALDHPKAQWSKTERGTIVSSLTELLINDTFKVAHNAPFEVEWLVKYLGAGVVNHAAWQCTQMQAQILDERRSGQSLDDLCQQHFGVAFKSFFKLDKRNMAKADLGETLIYNGVDTKYTLRLWHRQNELLEAEGLTEAYYEALPRQPTVALMQGIGVEVDQAQVKIAQTKLGSEIEKLGAEIDALKVVQAFKKDNGGFNPASGHEVIAIFRDYLKRPEINVEDKHTKESKVSVDKNVLDKIDHPLAKLIIQWRNRSKLKSTYVDCFEQGKGELVWPDGKIHTNFNCTFTETGRTSSDQPNEQNWPKRNDSWVRRQKVPGKGNVFIAADYGQLEACTAAMCSKDEVLIKALWDNYDIHMEWTNRLVKRYPLFLGDDETLEDEKTARKYRSIVKNKLVFPAIFGASNQSISGYLKTPEDAIDDLMDEFWATFHGLKSWQDELMDGYYKNGYVTSFTGRRHNYPLTRNQAINFPVQGVAADIVCDAMNRLSYLALSTNQWHLHPVLNIHDDLTFIVPDKDEVIEASIKSIYQQMLTPPYDFINVPLSVEISVGNNWYEMEEVGKYWSHKDL